MNNFNGSKKIWLGKHLYTRVVPVNGGLLVKHEAAY